MTHTYTYVHVQMCDNHTFPAVKCTFGDIDLDKK